MDATTTAAPPPSPPESGTRNGARLTLQQLGHHLATLAVRDRAKDHLLDQLTELAGLLLKRITDLEDRVAKLEKAAPSAAPGDKT